MLKWFLTYFVFLKIEDENLEDAQDECVERKKRKLAETEGNEGQDIKRMREEQQQNLNEKDYETILEGEDVLELKAQRPLKNEHFTRMDDGKN